MVARTVAREILREKILRVCQVPVNPLNKTAVPCSWRYS